MGESNSTNPFRFVGETSGTSPESIDSKHYSSSGTGTIPKLNQPSEKLRRFKTTREELKDARESYSALLKMVMEPNKSNFTAFCKLVF